MSHVSRRCEGGCGWYCGCKATVNFKADCGADANMCHKCHEHYTEVCADLKEFKAQQPNCLHCGEKCDIPSEFVGMIIKGKGQVCQECYPQYLKDTMNYE